MKKPGILIYYVKLRKSKIYTSCFALAIFDFAITHSIS